MYDMTRFRKKNLHLYVVPDWKSRDLSSSTYWPQNFFPIFLYFYIKMNTSQGYLLYIQNIKKVKNQPTLLDSSIWPIDSQSRVQAYDIGHHTVQPVLNRSPDPLQKHPSQEIVSSCHRLSVRARVQVKYSIGHVMESRYKKSLHMSGSEIHHIARQCRGGREATGDRGQGTGRTWHTGAVREGQSVNS